MLIPIIGIILGSIIGIFLPFDIPIDWIKYTSVAILAAVDAIFGGVRAQLKQEFIFRKFVISFFTNAVLAALLSYLGDSINLDIHLGAVIVFTLRIFRNLSIIREVLSERLAVRRSNINK